MFYRSMPLGLEFGKRSNGFFLTKVAGRPFVRTATNQPLAD